MITQIFIPTTEIAIPTGTPTSEANPEIETQPLTVETKAKSVQSNLKLYKLFMFFTH